MANESYIVTIASYIRQIPLELTSQICEGTNIYMSETGIHTLSNITVRNYLDSNPAEQPEMQLLFMDQSCL